MLGAVVRRFRDFAAAEDAVQEAYVAAAEWPRQGLPENPRAWLIQVASRRMTDSVRSEVARRRRETALAAELDQSAPPAGLADQTGSIKRPDLVNGADRSCTLVRSAPRGSVLKVR